MMDQTEIEYIRADTANRAEITRLTFEMEVYRRALEIVSRRHTSTNWPQTSQEAVDEARKQLNIPAEATK